MVNFMCYIYSGDRFYADANTILHGEVKDTPDAIERLVTDVNSQ